MKSLEPKSHQLHEGLEIVTDCRKDRHMKRRFGIPWVALSRARSAAYAIEGTLFFSILRGLNQLTPAGRRFLKPLEPATYQMIYRELDAFLRSDADRIAQGIYPPSVLWPESPLEHVKRIPKIFVDGLQASLRRMRGKTTVFSDEARDHLDDVPRYYRRNFHFQGDGYLSDLSAELYEHQVEILFLGAADAMRRLILRALRDRFGPGNGSGLRFLEVAAGTGRTTRFVKLAFPKAHVTAVDLSDPYLKKAQDRLRDLRGIDFVRADAAALPFKDGEFDAAYSVFLYHELPLEERRSVLRESARVIRPGGLLGLVDSIQTGDRSDIPQIEEAFEQFPQDFHEPYFRNYLATPMSDLLSEMGLVDVRSEVGFLSKLCAGRKPE